MAALFEPLTLRSVTFRNRIGVAPMCMYSAHDGAPNEWHMVHLGSRAVGGAATVIAEATAVEARGRISPWDTGIYTDEQAEAWKPIAAFIAKQGAVPGVQLAHAGRKASSDRGWTDGEPFTQETMGWETVAPSARTFSSHYRTPKALSVDEIQEVVHLWAEATKRALKAGFQLVEIHAAHGYLLHQFLSPLSNFREDAYGGSFGNRTRIVREVVAAVRKEWPEELPLFIRFSCSDWTEGGWNLPQTVALARELKPLGVDLVDCSSGGNVPNVKILVAPGYQVPFASGVRDGANISTAAVGLITGAAQAEEIVASGKADMVLLAREMLRDPYFPRRAAAELGATIPPPPQYDRAW